MFQVAGWYWCLCFAIFWWFWPILAEFQVFDLFWDFWKIVKIHAYFWDLWSKSWKKIRKIWKIHEFYLNNENWSEYLLKTAFFAIFWPILAILVNFWSFLVIFGHFWPTTAVHVGPWGGRRPPSKSKFGRKKIFHWSQWRFF